MHALPPNPLASRSGISTPVPGPQSSSQAQMPPTLDISDSTLWSPNSNYYQTESLVSPSEMALTDRNSPFSATFDDDSIQNFGTYLNLEEVEEIPNQAPYTIDPRELTAHAQLSNDNQPIRHFQPPTPPEVFDYSSPSTTNAVQGTHLVPPPQPLTSVASRPASPTKQTSAGPSIAVNLLHQMKSDLGSAPRQARNWPSKDAVVGTSPERKLASGSSYSSASDARQRATTSTSATSHLRNPSPRKGLGPDDRAQLEGMELPSLQEQDQINGRRKTAEGVSEWLTTTTEDPPNAGIAKTTDPKLAYKYHQAENGFDLIPASGEGFDWEIDEGSDLDERPPTPPGSKLFVAQSRARAKREPVKETLQGTMRHWEDSPRNAETSSIREAPPDSSTAAMQRFQKRAQEVDAASLAATYASSTRRGTETESIFSGFSSRVPSIAFQGGQREALKGGPTPRRESLLGRVQGRVQKTFHRNSDANGKKRKESSTDKTIDQEDAALAEYMSSLSKSELDDINNPLKKTPSGNQKKPGSHDFTARPGLSPNTAASFTSVAVQKSGGLHLPDILRRSRSRSNVSNGGSAIADQWAATGGPPVPFPRPSEEQMTAFDFSPDDEEDVPPDFVGPVRTRPHVGPADVVANNINNFHFADVGADEEDDDDGSKTPNAMDDHSKHMAIPLGTTFKDFVAHVYKVAPTVQPWLAERLAKEQVNRYDRLVRLRDDHSLAVEHRKCKSDERCPLSHKSGLKGPRLIKPPKARGNKESASAIYKVNANTPVADIQFLDVDETPQQASFPYGIPHPPVKQLPAEFECPICFRVKKIFKPSDWTKHCYEDLHPFTCSFEDCQQPKSFNRKADWARHENETHRHLESWICGFSPDCQHQCHRRDNFVQHLVRVHNLQEPRASGPRRRAPEDGSEVSRLVVACRHESSRQPDTEPCVFCDAVHRTWKDTCIHLSKHMMQISLPLLVLVEEQNGREVFATAGTKLRENIPQIGSLPGSTFANDTDGFRQAQHNMPRQMSQSLPGTKNLPRNPSPAGNGLVNGNTYLDVAYSQQYASNSGQNSSSNLSTLPEFQSRRIPSTYPPPVMASGNNMIDADYANFFLAGSAFEQTDFPDLTTSPSVGGGEMNADFFAGDMFFDNTLTQQDQNQQQHFRMDDNMNMGLQTPNNGLQMNISQTTYVPGAGMYRLPDGAHPSIYFPFQSSAEQFVGSSDGQGYQSVQQGQHMPTFPGWSSSSENLLHRMSRSHSHTHSLHDGTL